MREASGPVLLYDGHCALCNWSVRVVLRADRRGLFRFAPLHGDFAESVMARHPELRDVDSLVLVEEHAGAGADPDPDRGTRIRTRSDAVLRTASLLGGAWRLLVVFAVVPRPLRDWLYAAVARWRYRLFGKYETCPLPPPDVRKRFLA